MVLLLCGSPRMRRLDMCQPGSMHPQHASMPHSRSPSLYCAVFALVGMWQGKLDVDKFFVGLDAAHAKQLAGEELAAKLTNCFWWVQA